MSNEEKVAIPKSHLEAVSDYGTPDELSKFVAKEEDEKADSEEGNSEEAGQEPTEDTEREKEGVETEVDDGDKTHASGKDNEQAGETPAEQGSDEGEKELNPLYGVPRKKDGDGKTLFKTVQDGEEVWVTLNEAINGYTAETVSQKRFREAAEMRKELEEERKRLEEEREQMKDINSVFENLSPQNQSSSGGSDDLFDFGDSSEGFGDGSDDNEVEMLKNKLSEIESQLNSEREKKEKEKKEQELLEIRKKNITKAFNGAEKIIQKAGIERIPKEENPGKLIAQEILRKTGGYNDDYYDKIQDPFEVYEAYESVLSNRNNSSGTTEDEASPEEPPKGPIPDKSSSSKTQTKKSAIKEEIKQLQKRSNGDRVGIEEIASIGVRVQELQQKLKEL